jgi:hypothetical protein
MFENVLCITKTVLNKRANLMKDQLSLKHWEHLIISENEGVGNLKKLLTFLLCSQLLTAGRARWKMF